MGVGMVKKGVLLDGGRMLGKKMGKGGVEFVLRVKKDI